MSLTLSNLKPARGSTKKRKDIGRGGKRGTYSGRGLKGQKARSGGKSGLKVLGFRQTLLQTPKKRGFNSQRFKYAVVNLSVLDKNFAVGETVDLRALCRLGLAAKTDRLKILGTGQLTKKLVVIADAFSASAQKAIEAQGGSVTIGRKKTAV